MIASFIVFYTFNIFFVGLGAFYSANILFDDVPKIFKMGILACAIPSYFFMFKYDLKKYLNLYKI